MPLLRINNLSIGFQKALKVKPAVTDVNFNIERGEIFSLLGQSGSGKTLTALAIMQLLPVSARISAEAQVFLEKENLLDLSEAKMRGIRGKRISMIFQEPN